MDTIERSAKAVVGVVLTGLALPFGIAALVFYRHDRHTYAPGERSLGLRRPGWVIAAIVLAVTVMVVVILRLVFAYVPETNRRGI